MTALGAAAVLGAAVWVGWLAALVRAVARLTRDVDELRQAVDAMVVAEAEYATLWLPTGPVGGTGGERPLSEGEVEPPP